MWADIENTITASLGRRFGIVDRVPLAGGCINQAERLVGEGGEVFIKFNRTEHAGYFEAEAAALDAIRSSASVRVPQVLGWGSAESQSWLVLEYIELSPASELSEQRLGEQLAALHQSTAGNFGWTRDNAIGLTPQRNDWHKDWPHFFAHQRLAPQLELAACNGADTSLLEEGARLLAEVPGFFEHYSPVASLLHGDLWRGNCAADERQAPVLFDPATYFGDRETDIAMTELFGGFGRIFYRAYESAWPLDPGYRQRKVLYQLYHVLNHFNLFSGAYADQAGRMIKRLLAGS